MHFMGFRRKSGRVGTRNLLAFLPVVFCANKVALDITRAVPQAVAFPHPVGCGYPGPDQTLTARILGRLASHPNFGAVLLVGLGCERVRFDDVLHHAGQMETPYACVSIQEAGDSVAATRQGVRQARKLCRSMAEHKRQRCGLEDMVLGLKCGGTDAASGIAANPTLGLASDRIVAAGGSSILTEITELFGTGHIMERRSATPELGQAIRDCLECNMERLHRATGAVSGGDGERMLVSPGNADGGVSNVVEKALGGLKKAGSAPFSGCTPYAAPLPGKGLFLMDGPGHDGEAATGLAAAGATVIVFTTGRGTPAGFPGVPVIKSTGNPELAESMAENIDFNAGSLFRGEATMESLGEEMLACILRTASGELTRAEVLGHEELFCISRFMATHMHYEGEGILLG